MKVKLNNKCRCGHVRKNHIKNISGDAFHADTIPCRIKNCPCRDFNNKDYFTEWNKIIKGLKIGRNNRI